MVFPMINYPAGLLTTRDYQSCWYKRWRMLAPLALLVVSCDMIIVPASSYSLVRRHDSQSWLCWGSGATTEPEPQKAGLWLGGRWWRLGGWREYWSERVGWRAVVRQTESDRASSGTEESLPPPATPTQEHSRSPGTSTRTPPPPPPPPAPPWQGAQVGTHQHFLSQTLAWLISWVSRYQQTLGQTPWQTPWQYKTTLDLITL